VALLLLPGALVSGGAGDRRADGQARQSPDPIIGTWVLNVARSTFVQGRAPKSESRTYVLLDRATNMTAKGVAEPTTYRTVSQEIKATANMVSADGTATTREWTMVYDGKDRPITGDPEADIFDGLEISHGLLASREYVPSERVVAIREGEIVIRR